MHIALVNESTRVNRTQMALLTSAISRQVAREFCPAWNRAVVPVAAYGSLDLVPAGHSVLVIRDVCDDPAALGYHTEEGGVVRAVVGVQPVLDAGGAILTASAIDLPTVSSVVSHEVCEMIPDPFVNLWIDGRGALPNGAHDVALEVCDPVQGDSYVLLGVTVSNFILPAWMDATPPYAKKLDQMGRLTRPMTMTSGGYMVLRSGHAKDSQVFGSMPAWKAESRGRSFHRLRRENE